jgi:hypothetical protein
MMDGRGGTERKRRKIRINNGGIQRGRQEDREEYKEAEKKTQKIRRREEDTGSGETEWTIQRVEIEDAVEKQQQRLCAFRCNQLHQRPKCFAVPQT